jgi:tRNA(Arg) A34 adenosine deaminase TadA
MCSGAVILFGIGRVVMGENVTFVGGENLLKEYGVEVINLGEYFDLIRYFYRRHGIPNLILSFLNSFPSCRLGRMQGAYDPLHC